MADRYDLIVIGAGSAGLTAAGGAARFGLRVALIERDRMGGECLNTGCIPSKALIAAARKAHDLRTAGRFGVTTGEPKIDFSAVHEYVRATIAAVAPHDSQARFRDMGVDVIFGSARFLDHRTADVDGRRLSAARFVVAVGSKPAIPPIEGLAATPYLTNESLFRLDRLPRHLVILGGGAIGLELAQAFRRLGSEVTVVEAHRPLARDDPEAAQIVLDRLKREGVLVRAGSKVTRVCETPDGVRVEVVGGEAVLGSHLLVATGRAPALDDLGLEAAGVRTAKDGVCVDARRRTSNRRVWAIGDCREGPRLTHVAGYEGTVATANIALGLPTRVNYAALPWVTFTDPALAQVGLTEAEARERYGTVDVLREAFADNDRALTDDETAGFVKIVKAKRRLVGATLVGQGAGELVLPFSLAIGGKASLWAIANAIVPYPTRSEIAKATAFQAHDALIFNRWTRNWARALARLRS